MRHTNSNYGWLLRVTSGLLKYYGFFLIGLVGVGILAMALGCFPILEALLLMTGDWLWRLFVSLVVLLLIAVVYESLRY